jgi:hypothetical protein
MLIWGGFVITSPLACRKGARREGGRGRKKGGVREREEREVLDMPRFQFEHNQLALIQYYGCRRYGSVKDEDDSDDEPPPVYEPMQMTDVV